MVGEPVPKARRPSPWIAPCIAVLLGLFSGSPVRAADDDAAQTPSPAAATSDSPDFMFGAPRGWVGIRGSLLFPRAGGDLFAFVSDQLTVDRSDLRGRGVATDLGIVLSPRFDIVAGFDFTRRHTGSEYRHFIASNSQSITQTTRLQQSAISAGLRFSPTGRGRGVSRYAFIPRRLTPYAGGGANLVFYQFSQSGQFVDFADLSIFNDQFSSNGWGIGPYVNGGADVQLWKALFVTFDGRYSWLHSTLDADFNGFDGIDLAGFRGSTGISIVF
jgi:hypothetical protein